ncbi:uncharacterized protein [Epargyreus clarus]|uniref:uncharacterized protein isoform X2 n=1 Tax=Epargyreus clarus TaxID=520877 RepID=UPI003C2BEEB4
MTSQADTLKTNEFLRRRKLRLQQVREQSKDIAKKIRQRAKVEQLRHVTHVDSNKEKEYLQRQEKLVNRLEQLYSKGLQNIGAGHKNASEVNQTDIPEKKDLSKLRGKEAAAELRKKKQEKLDEQKKLLDRKLQAREAANELSREKSQIVVNNLTKSSSSKNINEAQDKNINASEKASEVNENTEQTHKDKSDLVTRTDMGTQWEFEEIPYEWEPNIPALSIPKDDSLKNSGNDAEKSDKSKRLNLFALSDEMPSSLRGGVTSIPDDQVLIKPSLTLVSEYLQNRGLRLREPNTTLLQKKSTDDLQSIKQTLLRTRASRTDGSVFPHICHVLDEQVIPAPSWRAEKNCEFCSHKKESLPRYTYKPNNVSLNKISAFRSQLQDMSLSFDKSNPCTFTRKCQHRHKSPVSGRSNNMARSAKSMDPDSALNKKNTVTMYDHNTRDTRDLPRNIQKLVVRDQSVDEDAYSQALKEASVLGNDDKTQRKVLEEARNRIAVTKQNVDKEYRDTLTFLNSLPKERSTRATRTAYMDGDRQQEMREKRQHRLQHEYQKIERECSKHHCKHAKCRTIIQDHNRSKSKSPVRIDIDNNVVNRDFQYSWMPVPESDGSLAIHTIPNTLKDKPGNTVKFSSVDTYHEYRSRHKHTPPTKDVNNESHKRVVETVIIQENNNDSMESSYETDTSSVENLQVKLDNVGHKADKDKIDDAERIIIYKVMESKKSKKHKSKNNSMNKAKMNEREKHNIGPENNSEVSHQDARHFTKNDIRDNRNPNTVSFTQLQEGVYKSVSANGDNVTSMYFSDDQQEGRCNQHNIKTPSKEKIPQDTGAGAAKEFGDTTVNRSSKSCENCKCTSTAAHQHTNHPSAATSSSSFKTALNDKAINVQPDGGYIKFVNEGGQDAGKFYVGASGFLKDDAYEVVIKLRKKEAEKNARSQSDDKDKTETASTLSDKNKEKNEFIQQPTMVQTSNTELNSPNTYNEDNKQKDDRPPKENPKSIIPTTQTQQPAPSQDNNSVTQLEANNSSKEKSPEEPPKTCDKAACTSFRDSFAIPADAPKMDPTPRPATSIYTQTTHSSPIHRPVFMHLSSSTSTTYMSPPDLVLPRYLRKGTSEIYDDTYEPASSDLNLQHLRNKECKACRCGKCKKHIKVNADTPPNTSRSTDITTDNANTDQHCNKYVANENGRKKVKPHKCKNRSDSKICSKQKFKRSSSENKGKYAGSNYSTLSNKKSKINHNLGKVNLNPIIENYVKKLLALNKEGLKAIEIVNQECSGVTTPGSSIIDVPSNFTKNKLTMCNKISLEQIKNSVKEQILKNVEVRKTNSKCNVKNAESQTDRNVKPLYKYNRKRPVHKVKSLNISKQFIKARENRRQSGQSTLITTSPLSVYSRKEKNVRGDSSIDGTNSRCKNYPSPRQMRHNQEFSNNSSNSERNPIKPPKSRVDIINTSLAATKTKTGNYQVEERLRRGDYPYQSHRITSTNQSSESESSNVTRNRRKLSTPPISISTQTNHVDSEVELMKLAEDKLQNMEKIADLTEKCTQRLSNLAKVLEEVRRNKSLAYSQISTSDSTSDTDQKSDKNIQANNRVHTFNPSVEIQTLTEALSSLPTSPKEPKNDDTNTSSTYVPILTDIPKPETFKTPSPVSFSTGSDKSDVDIMVGHPCVKNRGKPPPALTRMNLKNVPEGFVVPHELSTVVEVDSPMSLKLKNHTTRLDNEHDITNIEGGDDNQFSKKDDTRDEPDTENRKIDPKLTKLNKFNIPKGMYKTQSTDSSDDSKIKMMDLKQFNDIMLKPFITLQEYAKQYNIVETDDACSRNGISKDDHVNDELSSLHSEASLPDVMAELMKRNLISEPFKFETTSNVNSTTVSSESTLSLLALSRARKDKKKSGVIIKNKENITETSESLSISSNPDLEHAFQRLGMGWASSTLKKTKERLALSSSSNTSSSSMPHFKIKSFNYQDVPELSKESIMSLLNNSNKEEVLKPHESETVSETARNALQQTSLTNSMTVKEFLANELAKKITFSNKSNRNATEDDFVSLCETKMPEEIKHSSLKPDVNEKSVDSGLGGNNRARTSTPVQIFKSMTYHSTSSSNTSNGLFSNADDLSSVKGTSNSIKNHPTSDKDDLTIPNYSLKTRKELSDRSKSD